MRCLDDGGDVAEHFRVGRSLHGGERELAVEAERVLDEVVRPDRQEVGLCGYLVGTGSGLRRLDHRAEGRPRTAPVDQLADLVEQLASLSQLIRVTDERDEYA